MAKRNKKATRKIERLRDRLHHADNNPDFKVGWITRYMFVMDNFDIGETKRANENRWLYTIGPQRRTRYPFETVVIPGTHYTLHWFMQCKIGDPSLVPEFKYVPISTGATTLPFGTAPYVPTVQISQTKSDWVVVPQDPFLEDSKFILQCLAKCINQHNFTIFDARDLMHSLPLKLPLITHNETICELEFLERQRKGIIIGYQNRTKRKASVKLEGPGGKKPRLEVTDVASATRMLLDLLSFGPISVIQAAHQLQVKEKMIEQVVDVLMVVGHVTITNGVINLIQQHQTNHFTITTPPPTTTAPPHSPPTSPISSCDDSYGPIPETPPQSMPMWEMDEPSTTKTTEASTSNAPRPYATRSSTRDAAKRMEQSFSLPRSSSSPIQINQASSIIPLIPPIQHRNTHTQPPPTTTVKPPKVELSTSANNNSCNSLGSNGGLWSSSPLELSSFPPRLALGLDKFETVCLDNKPRSTSTSDITFESNLDLTDSSLVDFFQSSFWDQY